MLLTIVALHLALLLAVDLNPGIRDPLYGKRIGHILECQSYRGDHKPIFVMMLGTSRTHNGLNARWMEDSLQRDLGVPAVVCNYGIPGCGPITHQIHLRRLLEQGARPDLLFIEIFPRFYNDCGGKPFEDKVIDAGRIKPEESELLEKYGISRKRVDEDLEQLRQNPWGHLRFQILSQVRWKWVPMTVVWRWTAATDRWGWWPVSSDYAHGAGYEKRREIGLQEMGNELRDFRFGESAMTTLSDTLELCQREKIPTVLVHMPETSEFRSLYTPASKELIQRTFARLASEHGAAFIDATCWVPDGNFFDSQHLVQSGAELFTARLQSEFVLPRLRQGIAMTGK